MKQVLLKYRIRILSIVLMMLGGAFVQQSYGQILTQNGSGNVGAVTAAANAVGTAMTRGNGAATNTSCTTGFLATSLTTSGTFSTATNSYFETTVTANAGFSLLVTGFSADVRRSNTFSSPNTNGPASIRFAYSTDGGTTWSNNGAGLAPNSSNTCGNTDPQSWTTSFTVPSGTTLRVRVYAYSSGGTNGVLQVMNLTVAGSVQAPCVAPATQPSALVFGASSTTAIPGSFTGNGANGYLVVRSSGTVPSQPVDGTTYASGNIGGLGSGLAFVQTGATTSFSAAGSSNTQYTIYVYSYTITACTGGPKYSTATALSGSAYTCIDVASGLAAGSLTNSSASISWTASVPSGTVTSYDLNFRVGTTGAFTTLFGVSSPTVISSLAANTSYQYQIVSHNTNNTSCGTSTTASSTFMTALNPCVAPVDQPTAMIINNITTTGLRVNFTGNTASGWLVIQATNGSVPTQPIDGVTYNGGNIGSLGSNLTVVQGTGNTVLFNRTGLTNSTSYAYYVFSYNNTTCAGGPAYSTAAPLSGSAYTCIVAPTGLTATSASFTSENISWTASAGTVTSYDLNYRIGTTGAFTTILNVTSPYVLTGLTSNTVYNYQLVANNTNNTGTAACASATTGTSSFTTHGNPIAFVISTINTQTSGTPFSVTVQAQDASGTAEPVTADTYFTFTTNGNAGPNSGTAGGFIASGNSSGTVSGVDFLAAGTGVTITTTGTGVGDNLTPYTSNTFTVNSNSTDYFRSRQGGTWTTATNWQSSFDGTTWSGNNSAASSSPTGSAKLANVRATHTMNVTGSTTATNIVVDATGAINVNGTGITFTIANGSNPVDLDVNGTVTLTAGAISPSAGAAIAFNGTGVYVHNENGGTIPTSTWNDGSYCFVSGISTTIPGGLNPTNGFYNFTWNSNVTAAGLSINGGLTNVRGDFRYYGAGNSLRLTSAAALTMTVGGNFIDSSAIIFRLTDGASSPIINVTGDFRQYLAGTFDFGASTGAGTINVGGNYLRTGNSTQQKSSATGTLFGTINFNGINKTITNSGTQTSSGVNFNVTNGSIISLASNFQISSTGTTNSLSIANGGTLFCGAFNITGAVFTMNTNSTLGIGSLSATGGIQTATANGNIQTTTRGFAADGNYIYNGASAQFTGNGLPANLTGNLTINNAGGVSITQTTTLGGQLIFTAGKLNTNNLALTLAATSTITGAGLNSHILVGNGVTKTGTLVRTGVTGTANGFFPMGDGTYYLPATVTAAGGETYTGFVFSPVSTNGAFNGPAYADLSGAVNAVWDISSLTSTNATVMLDWSNAVSLEGSRLLAWTGNELGISHYTAGAWQPAVGSGNNSTHTATANFTSFSPFSIGSVGAPLPVTLSQFDATLNSDNTTNITWTTDIEINSAYFNVLRSTNGVDYTSIGSVTSHGNSSVQSHYQYTDPTPVTGVTYYRLQMVDLDGSSKYSEIKVVRPSAVTSISIFPNPARNFVNVSLGMNISKNLVIRLISQNGQLLQQKTVTNGAGTTISIPVSQYAEGMYLLQLIGSDGTNQSHKIIIGKQ